MLDSSEALSTCRRSAGTFAQPSSTRVWSWGLTHRDDELSQEKRRPELKTCVHTLLLPLPFFDFFFGSLEEPLPVSNSYLLVGVAPLGSDSKNS